MILLMQIAAGALSLAVAGILVWRFIAIRNPGYLILTLAIPLWGMVGFATRPLVESQIDRMSNGGSPSFPYSLLGDTTVGNIVAFTSIGFYVLQLALILAGFLVLALHSPVKPANSGRDNGNDRQQSGGPV